MWVPLSQEDTMDRNKLAVLQDAGYQIAPSCGICRHRNFASAVAIWGTCQRLRYEHQKHTGEDREASIFRGGSCPGFELDRVSHAALGGFAVFLGPPQPTADAGPADPDRLAAAELPPADAPVTPLVPRAELEQALDAEYDELAHAEAMSMLRQVAEMGARRPFGNLAISIAWRDGYMGTMLPQIPCRIVTLLAASSRVVHQVNELLDQRSTTI
jgi:hypothetical protein